MIHKKKIELLAPAKNLECGIAAIDHGADAVYIGAPKFGARAAAANSLEDIKQLCEYAHQFKAKVYVALNTILDDSELAEVEKLIHDIYYYAKADALIVQDMGITMLNLPPIPLHASTQMDNRSIEKVNFLEDAGFQQIVLARELNIESIKEIALKSKASIEVFVHGALCVSYSGQCYISQAVAGRSANKGACAQFCRLPYSLVDSEGKEILGKKHFLSMKDLNLSEHLEELLDGGVSSFKIEGRLKDLSYVKNVVAYYRIKLDEVLNKRSEFIRSSSGKSVYTFSPQLDKSFNRGFTTYFLNGSDTDMWSKDSPKSQGEYIGKVVEVSPKFIKVSTNKKISNGDGLCFLNANSSLEGFHVNRAENGLIYPQNLPNIRVGTEIFRNYDHEFEQQLLKKTAERTIDTSIELNELPFGFSLQIKDEEDNLAILNFENAKEIALKDQAEIIDRNLSKTGNTLFKVSTVAINFSENWFIPSSKLSEWRRLITEKLSTVRSVNYKKPTVRFKVTNHSFPTKHITYLGNVMNKKSELFYAQHESVLKQPAFERQSQAGSPLMYSRYCIKNVLGWCTKQGVQSHNCKEPFFLKYNNMTLRLYFDCKNCEMRVVLENK